MRPRLRVLRNSARVAAALMLVSLGLAGAPASASTGGNTPISGSGSSWAAIAIDQWISNIRSTGIVVNYNPDGIRHRPHGVHPEPGRFHRLGPAVP